MRALITGASSGIGRDMARVLAAAKYDLILVARRQDRLEELKKEFDTGVEIICTDLSVPENCIALYNRFSGDCPDVVINNAGFGLFGAHDEVSLDRELELIDLNIKAVHILTKLFLSDMEKRNSGYIMNVSSSAGFLPGPLLSAYYASKAYVLRYSEAMYEELRRRGSCVSISVLCPGPVSTEFDAVAGVKFSLGSLSSEYVARYAVKKMFERKLIITPGFVMKVARVFQRFPSDKMLARITYSMQKRKQTPSKK